MNANKTIVIGVILYVVLFIILSISFVNTKFTGNDAAGNGMAKGLTFFYGLGILFIFAVVLTIINAFFLNRVTHQWIKFIFFVPVLLPIVVFSIEYFEIGSYRPPSTAEQVHRLTIEIKTTKELGNPRYSFRSSKGGSHSKLNYKKMEGSFHFYENSNAIFYETGRVFYIRSDELETPEYELAIPYELEIVPFTDWETFFKTKGGSKDSIDLEFRYKISK